MNSIKFRIAAKTDVGLVRENNEDNFQASSDLSVEPMRWVNNEICSLGEKGALLVVADGMGGMNAGEVASQLAIETVRSAFSPQNLTNEVMKNRFSIEKFMNSVVEEADMRIKSEAKAHPESRGMGTTIVIGWLLNGKLYLSWCGDSRAYVYNPKVGLHQITKDHSYVQSLVDKGAISKEDAFDYPESNIITRCLSDSTSKAKPESLLQPYDICENDIIILCTDGLSGMIRDNEIEGIIRRNEHDMDACSDALIRAACDAEGADNITICMCQILQGGGTCNPKVYEEYDKRLAGPAEKTSQKPGRISTKIIGKDSKRKKWLYGGIALLMLIAITLGVLYFTGVLSKKDTPTQENNTKNVTTAKVATQTLVSTDGQPFTLERREGEPQVGDKAYPDGSYTLDANRIVIIKDSIVVSIDKKDSIKTETETRSDNTKKLKTNNSLFNDLPKSLIPGVIDSTDIEDDELTPIKETTNVDTVHVVKPNENLSSIGKHYGITTDVIKSLNPEIDGDKIKPGDKLRIKFPKKK